MRSRGPGSVIKKLSFLRSALAALSCDLPPDFSLAFGAIICNPTPVGFGERSFQCSSFEVVTICWRSGLLPPGFVQITTVDRIESKIIDKLKHSCPRFRRIAEDRQGDPTFGPLRNPFFAKALCKDVVERLYHRSPDLLRYPPALDHAVIDGIDSTIA